jgi:transposase InsO family protein
MALGEGRKPEIFHSDQGFQFTSSDFVARLRAEKIKISWSGRKRCFDNILVERLWRTLKDVAEGFSPPARRGLSVGLQRWLGGRDQAGSFYLEVWPRKTSQCLGWQNYPSGLY